MSDATPRDPSTNRHEPGAEPLDFRSLVDLAAERVGGAVLHANDDFFAPKENLLRAAAPVFIDGKYTDRGKWMDGWESRRRRAPGHDWCIVKLGLPGVVHGFDVDTAFFRGNFPEACSFDALCADGDPDLERLLADDAGWTEIVPRTSLAGDSHNLISLPRGGLADRRWTHLRFHIYPDGGVARLRVHGEVVPDWVRIVRRGAAIDLASVENGGVVVACNDMFFGSRHNLIMPGRSVNMGDGWETKRKRPICEGSDWTIVRLGARGALRSAEVDTNHFKGNFPESCMLEACDDVGGALDAGMAGDGVAEASRGGAQGVAAAVAEWRELLPRTKLRAHTRHFYDDQLRDVGPVTHVRLTIYPDGGVSRLRLIGEPRPRETGGR